MNGTTQTHYSEERALAIPHRLWICCPGGRLFLFTVPFSLCTL
ncbi:MAG: hypothetical protein P1P84_06320 [Deferrisomatales bacterium]|nr:hypothetical protein [Deferrisomatales bacterium]